MVTLVAQWLAAYGGGFLHKRWRPLTAGDRKDFDTVQTATLTLLALIIGFSFSMAVTRYDQRKNYEEAEANAIGTAYVRADLLSPDDAVRVRDLLKAYLDQRVAFYLARDQRQLSLIDTDTAKLQSELWSAVSHPASTDRTAMAALAVSGINDVLNSQGYTQAAWWNRIPSAAWWLMGLIAISANVLFGYGERGSAMSLLLILPIIVAIAFFLIADIDNPRGGVICVLPHNLVALSQFIKAQ
jgi:hypothetical protein